MDAWIRGGLALLILGTAAAAPAQIGPQPGEVYREYKKTMRGSADWRVTDPSSRNIRAHRRLPNPILSIRIDDLQHAVRGEVLIDRWGGHAGTTAKRIRINENSWLFLPELQTTPPGTPPERYMYQDNPIVPIPLEHLRQGENKLEGTAGGQIATTQDWGQWGWNGIVIRIYYDPLRKTHVKGRIATPRSGTALGEDPVIVIEPEKPADVRRVDVLGHYEGYDEDGDGRFLDWHRYYAHDRKGPDGADEPAIRGHIGSAYKAPFEVRWDTRWVPDQRLPVVQLVARIQSQEGLWYVTDPVGGLRLERSGVSVRLHKPQRVPERFCVRAGMWMMSSFQIPAINSEWKPVEALLHLRTWNGHDKDVRVNGWKTPVGGGDHVFAYTQHDLPAGVLRRGDNRVEFYSETEDHCIEVLWPGPGVTVRYTGPEQRKDASVTPEDPE